MNDVTSLRLSEETRKQIAKLAHVWWSVKPQLPESSGPFRASLEEWYPRVLLGGRGKPDHCGR